LTAPPLHVCIVGAGPAGLYAAAHLLEQRDADVRIDVLERLPTPWGLVRAGVAPDHPEKKLIIDRHFDFVLKSPRLRFFGHVEVGADIGHAELAACYDAVIYAVGAAGDVRLDIPGEHLPGSWAAREFVAFYNGHPDHGATSFDLTGERAVIVGNGNVALDLARMLTRDAADLAWTDISDTALAALRASRVREVVILGRRGPLQAAYNNPELEEFFHLEDVDVAVEGVEPEVFEPAALAGEDLQTRRKMQTLRALISRPQRAGRRRVVFRFLRSPLRLEGDGRVERLTLACNALVTETGGVKVGSTGRTESLEAGLVFRAVGYRGAAMPGLPFDATRGVIRNTSGRVEGDAGVLAGVYASGWVKRGCNGIIGTNKACAHETVRLLLEDFRSGRLPARRAPEGDIEPILRARKPDLVAAPNWSAIDHAERSAGRAAGRPRVKITTRAGLLAAAGVIGRAEARHG